MKQGQGSKRARGRNSGRRGSNRQQLFDSNGPSVRIRGNAFQVHEKYLGLARDAASSGDRIGAENYYQHAEHYFRIHSVDLEERNQRLASNGQGNDGQRRPHPHGHRGNGQPPANGANGAHGTNGVNDEELDATVSATASEAPPEPEPREPAPKRTPRRSRSSARPRVSADPAPESKSGGQSDAAPEPKAAPEAEPKAAPEAEPKSTSDSTPKSESTSKPAAGD